MRNDDDSDRKSTTVYNNWSKKERKETVFVDIDATRYYEYTVTNKDCKIQINLIDFELKTWSFEFKKENEIQLIDAYNHIILVQEVSPTGDILSLWVIQIFYDAEKCKFWIDSFAVNSVVDSEFFYFDAPYYISEILEYDPIENWISVVKISKTSVNIFKINVGQQINVLLIVGWFDFKRNENV